MLVKTWRFCAVILAALSMAMAFCHLLEMPSRLAWGAPLWIATTVTGNVFRVFGSVGAAIETLAWIAAVALVILVLRMSTIRCRSRLAGVSRLMRLRRRMNS